MDLFSYLLGKKSSGGGGSADLSDYFTFNSLVAICYYIVAVLYLVLVVTVKFTI